jgi:hypothetical protein
MEIIPASDQCIVVALFSRQTYPSETLQKKQQSGPISAERLPKFLQGNAGLHKCL